MHLSRIVGAGVAIFLALATAATRAATGTIQDVQHVVILMNENRSMDHYCGMMAGVRGFGDRHPLLLPNGQSDFYQPDGAGGYVLPYPITNACVFDLDHDFPSGEYDWDNGKWDEWIPAKGGETMSYFTPDYMALHQALANNYTICDNSYCSLIGPTYPNRLYLFTGMIDPNGTGGGPAVAYNLPASGFTWTTYPERLQNAGVSWRVYRPQGDWFGDALPWFAQYKNAAPGNPLYDRGVAEVPDVVAALLADVTNGTLPQVSWIIPTLPQSGHPPFAPQMEENFVGNVLNALAANPAVFNSTIFILTYDEGGGFFDHVPSPTAPWNTPDEFVSGLPLGLGVRVPMLLVSPWSRGGHVCSQVFDHTSIIRFLETWTGVHEPNISAWRRKVCGDLTSAFDFAHPNTNNYPVLPTIQSLWLNPYDPDPPATQAMPVQLTNALLSVPLPYQPEVTAQTDCAARQVHLTFTNGGAASLHFATYPIPLPNLGPVQCDVAPGTALTLSWPITGQYDLTCYSPNGFQRRFAGNIAADCGQIEAVSVIDTNAGTITAVLQNSGSAPVAFAVTDNYGFFATVTNAVAANSTGADTIYPIAVNNGWYDVTVTASADATFVRHFTGHIETGAWTFSEPVSSVTPPQKTTQPTQPTSPQTVPVQLTLTNAPSVLSLMASIPPAPDTNSLPLYSAGFGTNMALFYPAWASNCTVLASATMAPGSWLPVSAPLTNMGNYTVAVLPASANAEYFLLRQ